jgi:hypothetical protein
MPGQAWKPGFLRKEYQHNTSAFSTKYCAATAGINNPDPA